MAKKKKRIGTVYSTDPDFDYQHSDDGIKDTLSPEDQRLIILLDKKARKGKKVTLIEGFVGHPDDLKALAKELKSACGVGGSAKDGEIILQGDFREKIGQLLEEKGYSVKVRK